MPTTRQDIFQDRSWFATGLFWLFISLFFCITAEATTIEALIAGAENGSIEDQYNLGKRYLAGKEYENARKWLAKAAEQGHVKAQTQMGWLYEHGKGVKKDYEVAFAWYEKAANQGDGYAQRPLGKFYELGLGVDPSPEKAFYWYEKAAQQGIARAQANLGILYETGVGVETDNQKAVFWYRKTAEAGYPRGQYLLGKMYEDGLGVEKNSTVAKMWYQKSAASKYSRAIERLQILEAKGLDKSTIVQNETPSLSITPKQEQQPDSESQAAPESFDDTSILSEDLAEMKTMDRDQAITTAQYHFVKGNDFFKNGQLAEAVGEYKKSLIYNPVNDKTLANLGITYAELGKIDEGIKTMREAISAKPTNSNTYALLGLMLHASQKDREALVQYQNAIKYNPTLPDIYFYMAFIFTELKDYDRAWTSLHMAEFFGYQDEEFRQKLLSLRKEPEISWPEEEKGYYLRQIVLSTKEKAQEIRQQLIDGADFSALVTTDGLEQYSDNNGYMGYLEADEIVPETLELLKKLPPFSYSEILETDKGFYIFQRLMVPTELYAPID